MHLRGEHIHLDFISSISYVDLTNYAEKNKKVAKQKSFADLIVSKKRWSGQEKNPASYYCRFHKRQHGISVHHDERDCLSAAFLSANLSPVRQKKRKKMIPESTNTPGGVLISSRTAGKPAAFDVIMTSPVQSTTVFKAAEKTKAALEIAEARNHNAHTVECDQPSFLLPPAVETLGDFSMKKTLKRLALLSDSRSFFCNQ